MRQKQSFALAGKWPVSADAKPPPVPQRKKLSALMQPKKETVSLFSPTPTYKIYLFDTSCHLFSSLDTGATWSEVGSPAPSLGDDWPDMVMAINDGDYDTILPVDSAVNNGNSGGVSLCTFSSYPTSPILDFGTPSTYTSITAAMTAGGATILVPVVLNPTTSTKIPRISTDSGATWNDVASLGPASPINIWTQAAFSTNASVMYMQKYGEDLYKSLDGGTTWIDLPTSPALSGGSDTEKVCRLRCSSNGSIVCISDKNSGDAQFYVSVDSGSNWAATDIGAMAGWVTDNVDFGMTPDGSVILVVAGNASGPNAAAWKSTDQGATWVPLTLASPSLIGSVCNVAPDGLGMVVGYDLVTPIFSGTTTGNADISTDGGATWTPQTFTIDAIGMSSESGVFCSSFILPISSPPPPSTFCSFTG